MVKNYAKSFELAANGREMMPFTKFEPEIVMFDLDGTLVDSVPDLAYCVDLTMAQVGLPSCGEAAVRTWVGNGVEKLLERALCNDVNGTADAQLFAKARPVFWAAYQEFNAQLSTVYPGVLSGLNWLKAQEYKLACVTNKSATFTAPLLQSMGLSDYFDVVVSGDTCRRKKPDAMPLQYAAQQLGVKASKGLMIGDSKTDIRAARAAGCPVFAVPYGYNHGEDVADSQPDIMLDTLEQLPDYLVCVN